MTLVHQFFKNLWRQISGENPCTRVVYPYRGVVAFKPVDMTVIYLVRSTHKLHLYIHCGFDTFKVSK
jgi:hypothetical protein